MEYKKFLIFFAVFVISVGLVSAAVTVTSKSRSSTGAAFTEISTENDVSIPNSLRLFASEITSFPPTNEARFRVNFASGTKLSDLESVSWMQFVDHGYISHVDVLLDINGNGVYDGTAGGDDALVFEYAKVKPSLGCDDVDDYPLGSVDTFGDKGIVDNDAWAWLTSGPAGGCASPATEFFWHVLSAWKAGVPPSEANGKTINGNTKVVALEIEVDGWIAESEAFIDDVKINNALVENFDGAQVVEVEIVALTLVSIAPTSLNFGSLSPGTTDNAALNGPILFDATGSNTNVNIEVASVTGFPFADGLEFDGFNPVGQDWDFICVVVNNVCTYPVQSTEPTLSIPAGAVIGEHIGTVTYTVTGSPP